MDKQLQQLESLQRAKNGDSLLNYPSIMTGFMSKGINANDIIPRVNVFTYNAWKALGRQVSKGEHGVKVVTWIDANDKIIVAVSLTGFACLMLIIGVWG